MPAAVLSDADRAQLQALLADQPELKVRRRAQALLWVCDGLTQTAAGRKVGIKSREVKRTLQRWTRRRDLEALKDGTPARNRTAFHGLDGKKFTFILELDPTHFGHETWSVAAIADYLRKEHSLQIAHDTVYDRLERAGFRYDDAHKEWRLTAEPKVRKVPYVSAVVMPIPRELQALLARPAELDEQASKTLLPTFAELCTLHALRLAHAGTTVRTLAATLQGHVNPATLTGLLYDLRSAGYAQSEARGGLQGDLWTITGHGRCVLELIEPWIDLLYREQHEQRRFLRALPLLFLFESCAEGVYMGALRRALGERMGDGVLYARCQRLAAAPGWLAARTGPDGEGNGDGRLLCYSLTPIGRALLRLIRALQTSQRTQGMLPAAERRALLRYRPPAAARVKKPLTLPVLNTGEVSGALPRLTEWVPRQADLRLLRLLRSCPAGLNRFELHTGLPLLSPARIQHFLIYLQRQHLVTLAKDERWQLSKVGAQMLAILERNAEALYTAGYLPKQMQMAIVLICGDAATALTMAEIAAQAARLGLDPRWVGFGVQEVVTKDYLYFYPRTQPDEHGRLHNVHQLTARGKRAYQALRVLLQLLEKMRPS